MDDRQHRHRHPAPAPTPTAMTEDEQAKRMAIVCWSNDLDRVWPTLILATTGAASGLEVDVFFTFWGLRVLQRNNKRITGKNWMQKGESLVDRGGTDHLKLGKINFGGMGTMMIKKLARQHKVANATELLEMAHRRGRAAASLPDDHGPVRADHRRLHRRPAADPGRGQLHRHGGEGRHHALHLKAQVAAS